MVLCFCMHLIWLQDKVHFMLVMQAYVVRVKMAAPSLCLRVCGVC